MFPVRILTIGTSERVVTNDIESRGYHPVRNNQNHPAQMPQAPVINVLIKMQP